MFSIIHNWINRKVEGTQRREAEDWIRRLRNLSDEEVAPVLLFATHQKTFLRKIYGVEPDFPALALSICPTICIRLNQNIRHCQKDGVPMLATGLIVWLLTFRAMSNLGLRDTGRTLWTELQRGKAHIHEAADQFTAMGFGPFDYRSFETIPDGMEPLRT